MDLLDLKDRKILHQLDLDARQSDSEIAKKVGLSRDAVRYRINKMVEQGYIHYFMTLLNSLKLGYMWMRTFFKFNNLNLEKEKEIIDYLKQRSSWITRVEGPWDLNTGIFVKSIYEYRDIINEFLLLYGSFIERYDVATVTRMWIYHKDYLIGKKQKITKQILIGYNPEEPYIIEGIDEMDYKILQTIIKNANMKTVNIASAIGATEMVVRYRMKRMWEKGVIIGYVPFINVHKLGFMYFKLHLKLKDLTTQKHKKLVYYVHQHPNTVYTTELVGGADLETEFQVRSNEEFYEHIKDLRLKFSDIIRDYEFMQYTKEYKFTYLPEMSNF